MEVKYLSVDKEPTVQVCDATEDEKRYKSWLQKITLLHLRSIHSKAGLLTPEYFYW